MPILELIGSAIIAGATLAFNPIRSLIANPLIVGVITIIIGLAVFHFGGKTKFGTISKIVGAGFTIAGLLPLVSGLVGMVGGKLGATATA